MIFHEFCFGRLLGIATLKEIGGKYQLDNWNICDRFFYKFKYVFCCYFLRNSFEREIGSTDIVLCFPRLSI